MNIAFALFKYFPYGGLQRDMLRIAQACVVRGAEITVYCGEWQGEQPAGIRVQRVPVTGRSNHRRNRAFAENLRQQLTTDRPVLLVGFNKMAGLDLYYAADTCFKAKLLQERLPLLRWLPRYRQYLHDEAAVFGAESNTQVLAIAQRSVDEYTQYYPGTQQRCTVLPPGINRDRCAGPDALAVRESFRREWCLQADDRLVLMIGSGFRTKGLDRAIRAVAALPDDLRQRTRFIVIGQDKPDAFLKLAGSLGVAGQLQFLSGRDDIPQFLQGADVLIHPAYRENTGTVLLEAAVAGLPVLTTAACGYSSYIRDYACGVVIDEPFVQQQLDQALATMLHDDGQRTIWRDHALQMAQTADIYSLFERAADIIIKTAQERQA